MIRPQPSICPCTFGTRSSMTCSTRHNEKNGDSEIRKKSSQFESIPHTLPRRSIATISCKGEFVTAGFRTASIFLKQPESPRKKLTLNTKLSTQTLARQLEQGNKAK